MCNKGKHIFLPHQTILPQFIEGNKNLSKLIGVQDKGRLQQLRAKGLPYYTEGKNYIYNVAEVLDWYHNYLKNSSALHS